MMATDKDYKYNLFNKSQRSIHFQRPDKDGEMVNQAFNPQTAGKFSKEERDKIVRLFPTEVIDMDNVKASDLVDRRAAAAISEDEGNQTAEIEKRLSDARALRAHKAYGEAKAEGFADWQAKEIAGMPLNDADLALKKKQEDEEKAAEAARNKQQ